MDCIRTERTHAEHSLKGVGSRTQMGNRAQILEGMTLFLERIIRCRRAFDRHFFGLNLKRLLRLRCRNEFSPYDNCCADIDLHDLIIVGQRICVYHLNRLKECSIIHNDKSKIFGIAVASDPASNGNLLIFILLCVTEYLADINQFHNTSSFCLSSNPLI